MTNSLILVLKYITHFFQLILLVLDFLLHLVKLVLVTRYALLYCVVRFVHQLSHLLRSEVFVLDVFPK